MKLVVSSIVAVLPCLVAFVICPNLAQADQPTIWGFTVETTGQNVYWTSPTAVSNTADRYDAAYQITKLVATVKYSIFPPFDVDVTDQIPADQRGGGGSLLGPLPITIFEDNFAYPLPPNPPSVSAHVLIQLTADGHAYAAITNVYLGDMSLPPFGTVHIQKLHLEGEVAVWPLWYADMDCDGVVNAFDIDPFVLALIDAAGYANLYPNCKVDLADCDHDGQVNAFDIDAFVACIVNNGCP
jgi:hypothetical protein